MNSRQTIGEHCWNVYRIYCDLWGALPSAETAYYIIHHDSAELVTGDPPFPFKRDNPDVAAAYARAEAAAHKRLGVVPEWLKLVTDAERARVKVCDLLEMHSHGLYELELGNAHAVPIVQRTCKAALGHAGDHLGHSARVLVQQYVTQVEGRHRVVMDKKKGAI